MPNSLSMLLSDVVIIRILIITLVFSMTLYPGFFYIIVSYEDCSFQNSSVHHEHFFINLVSYVDCSFQNSFSLHSLLILCSISLVQSTLLFIHFIQKFGGNIQISIRKKTNFFKHVYLLHREFKSDTQLLHCPCKLKSSKKKETITRSIAIKKPTTIPT